MGRVYPNPKTRPEPEAFSPTRNYPNPNFSQSYKPETTQTRTFQDFKNPKLPEPEIKTRGYPIGLKLLQNSSKDLKIIANICTKFMPNLHCMTFCMLLLLLESEMTKSWNPNKVFFTIISKILENHAILPSKSWFFRNPKTREPEGPKPEPESCF